MKMLGLSRALATALAVFVLSLAVAAPGQALGKAKTEAMDDCPHAATVESLGECVEHAWHHGFIDNEGIVESLFAKLDAAQAAIERDRPTVAGYILQAFILEVQAQAGRQIAQPHADHLVTHAWIVIQALQ